MRPTEAGYAYLMLHFVSMRRALYLLEARLTRHSAPVSALLKEIARTAGTWSRCVYIITGTR